MSILKNNQNKEKFQKSSYLWRFSQLAKMGEIIFHIDDLALI